MIVDKKQEQLLQEATTPKFDNSQLMVDTDAYDEMYQLAEAQMRVKLHYPELYKSQEVTVDNTSKKK